jgi:hypothetical protein
VSLTRPSLDKTTLYFVSCTIDGEVAQLSFLVKPENQHTVHFKGTPLDNRGVKRKHTPYAPPLRRSKQSWI